MARSNGVENVEQKFFQRFSFQWRIQHGVMFASFLVLVFSAVPLWCLKHPGFFWWSASAMRQYGFIEKARFVHRIGAVGLIAVSIYHMLYIVYTREGRREFIELLPRFKDFVDLIQNSLYFLGLRSEQPRFDRYTYYEKFDYWAVYWGCVIMIGSGVTLWFPEISAKVMPWFPYNLASVIHRDEAILAALAVFIWHFYNVHFSPEHFPGTLLWWHGKISRKDIMHSHPLEYEKLKRGKM
jgi:formate dehydrogenase subunit gamma